MLIYIYICFLNAFRWLMSFDGKLSSFLFVEPTVNRIPYPLINHTFFTKTLMNSCAFFLQRKTNFSIWNTAYISTFYWNQSVVASWHFTLLAFRLIFFLTLLFAVESTKSLPPIHPPFARELISSYNAEEMFAIFIMRRQMPLSMVQEYEKKHNSSPPTTIHICSFSSLDMEFHWKKYYVACATTHMSKTCKRLIKRKQLMQMTETVRV